MSLRVVARAPNHLGDGVMALPAMHALAGVGELTIHAPGWGPSLYRDVACRVVARDCRPEGDVAVLFPPSFRVAWEARHLKRRVGVASDWRRWLLTDVVPEGTHQADTYAALAERVGSGLVEGPPRWTGGVVSPQDLPEGHIGLNPVSVSGAVRQWRGYAELADRLSRPVVFYGGPGEEAEVGAVAGDRLQCVGLPLPEFAGALGRCAVFVSNDSGAAHFARACEIPTVVVYGSTTASRTGPAGSVGVEGPDLPCRPCYRGRCRYELGCLDISVSSVLEHVQGLLR
jgi:ADP-heptose:LPS heptosyltransferase